MQKSNGIIIIIIIIIIMGLQDLILVFKIPMGKWNNFFDIWSCALKKVRHPWTKRLAALGTAEREKRWANIRRVAVVTIQSNRSSEPWESFQTARQSPWEVPEQVVVRQSFRTRNVNSWNYINYNLATTLRQQKEILYTRVTEASVKRLQYNSIHTPTVDKSKSQMTKYPEVLTCNQTRKFGVTQKYIRASFK